MISGAVPRMVTAQVRAMAATTAETNTGSHSPPAPAGIRQRLEFVAATAVRGWQPRANFCDASFF